MSEVGTQDRGAVNTMVDASSDDARELSDGAAYDRAPSLERGAQIGRYHVLARIGAGGMGVVYAAYDSDLDRRVAIKLLHRDALGSSPMGDGRASLMREAQAMAKLSHPNVVAVHDVGMHAGAVFMAMEFVQGVTVAEWIGQSARAWPEVRKVFIAAARGLAAAHDAGLVHRDFKPANVMLAEDGGVKVADFGLARRRDEARGDEARGDDSTGGGNASPSPATDAVAIVPGSASVVVASRSGASDTQAGAVVGTPAYMAPEQHLALPIDGRTDQFSYCIAFHEALYGRRPFTSRAPSALALDAVEGRIPDPPVGSKVPAWLREIVLRGLEPDPQRRYPSMAALLVDLERDPNAVRRKRLFAGGAVAAIVAAAIALKVGTPQAQCTEMSQHLVGVWDEARSEQIREAVFALGVGFAQSTWDRVEHGLDDYTEKWVAARHDACTATRVRGEQSAALMDLRMECLDGRLRSVRALVEVVGEADATVLSNAVVMVNGLPELAPCADTKALRDQQARPSDPTTLTALDVLDQKIADAEQLERAGKYPEALAVARDVADAAEPLGFAPMTARAWRRLGALEHVNGAVASAEATLRKAYFLAVRHHLDQLAAQSAAELVTIVGEVQLHPVDGRLWAEHAGAYAEALGDVLIQATVIHSLAGVALREGKYDEARELAARGLALREAKLGAEHDSVLASVNTLGLIAIETGDFDQARAYFGRALTIAERTYGADHPELGKPINNLANIAWREGKYDQAKADFERALVLQRAALGPEHRNVAQLENNLAAVAMSTGHHQEAQLRFERALEIWRKVLGPEHPMVADALNNLAVVAVARGDFEQGREFDERALAIREKTMAADHPALAQNYGNLGTDLYRLGRVTEAQALHERALAIYEKKLDPSHDDIAMMLTALGADLLALDQPDRALPLLERAFALRVDAQIDPVELASTHWSLAQALFAAVQGRDRKRALELAQRARAAFAAMPESTDNALAQIDVWLAAH